MFISTWVRCVLTLLLFLPLITLCLFGSLKLIHKNSFISFTQLSFVLLLIKLLLRWIVNRLKLQLYDIIFPYQSSFILGPTIHHHIVVAHEMVHSMARMNDNKGFRSIKIDLKKACDTISWNFGENCLVYCKFPLTRIHIIHHCITSPSYKILWNGAKIESISPTRGIRLEDNIDLGKTTSGKFNHIIRKI